MSRQRTVMKRTAQTVHRKNNIYPSKKHTNGMLFFNEFKIFKYVISDIH